MNYGAASSRLWGSMYGSSGFKIQSAEGDQTEVEMKELMVSQSQRGHRYLMPGGKEEREQLQRPGPTTRSAVTTNIIL